MIFQKVLEGASNHPEIIEAIFSKNLMACLMNQAAKEDRYLHRAATKALKTIDAVVEKDPSLLKVVLRQLLGEHGAYNFDERTNTKTVDKLLQYTKPQSVESILKVVAIPSAGQRHQYQRLRLLPRVKLLWLKVALWRCLPNWPIQRPATQVKSRSSCEQSLRRLPSSS
jgi:hypothetical protein